MRKSLLRLFIQRFEIIVLLIFFGSCNTSKHLSSFNSQIEIIERDYNKNKADWKNKNLNIRVEFYDNDNKNEPIGLMLVSINGVHFVAEIDGIFERSLYSETKYKFKFYAPGFEEVKKEIEIKKDKEYLIKAFMKRKKDEVLK